MNLTRQADTRRWTQTGKEDEKIRGLEDEKIRKYEMKQIVQNLKNGKTELVEVPCPAVKAGYLLIQTSVSLESMGSLWCQILNSE